MCNCGIPNKANWYTQVIYVHNEQTSYTDVYSCDEHFPGYPDGSMSRQEAHWLKYRTQEYNRVNKN